MSIHILFDHIRWAYCFSVKVFYLKQLTVCYKSILYKRAFFVKKIHNFIAICFPLPLNKPFTRGFRSVG